MYHPNRNWDKKHRFSTEIKQQIIALHQLDNRHGIIQVLEDWFWIIGAIALPLYSCHYLPHDLK